MNNSHYHKAYHRASKLLEKIKSENGLRRQNEFILELKRKYKTE